MRWTRGLLRLWIAVSICWVVIVGGYATMIIATSGDRYEPWRLAEEVQLATVAVLVPPVVLLLVGYLGMWVISGFLPDR